MSLEWMPTGYGSWQTRHWGCDLHVLQLANERWSWLVEVDGYIIGKGVAVSFATARLAAIAVGAVVTDEVAA